jgi:hypothetical protein
MNLQTIESSIFLKHWMGQTIGPKMRKSHELYFQDKSEEDKLMRENEISYYFKVVSGMIDLQLKHSPTVLNNLGFSLFTKKDCIEWIPNEKTDEFRELFEGLFDLQESTDQKMIFTPFSS